MWSKTKKQLLSKIHPSIKNKIDFQFARFRKSHDQMSIEFRILYDKEIIFKIDNLKYEYENNSDKYDNISNEERWADLERQELYTSNEIFEAIKLFNCLSIKEALSHENKFVRMLAILDKKIGKRTIEKINVENEWNVIKKLYEIRKNAFVTQLAE